MKIDKNVIGILLIFLAGLLIGSALTRWTPGKCARSSEKCEMGPHAKFMKGGTARHERMFKRLSQKLELTDEQKQKVKAILDDKHEQIMALHEQTRPKIQALFETSRQEIRKLLTPAQQQKFDKWHEKMKNRMGKMKGYFGKPCGNKK